MIHLARDGVQLGTFTPHQVAEMLATGQLLATDLAWQQGQPSWLPLAELPNLAPAALSDTAALPSTAAVPPMQPNPQPSSPASLYEAPRSVVSGAFHQPGQVPPGSILALKGTRPWTLFLAILGVIGSVLLMFAAVGMIVAANLASSSRPMPSAYLIGMAVAYVVLGLLYLYPIVKLFKFSSAIKRLTHSGQAADLDAALGQQRQFWKFMGIAAILVLVTYLVVIVTFVSIGVGPSRLLTPPPAPVRPPTSLVPAAE